MNKMPFIPEFTEQIERAKWIVAHAQYFTVILSRTRFYRQEKPSLDEAIKFANQIIKKAPDARLLIYGVYGMYDTLAATISSDGVKYHT